MLKIEVNVFSMFYMRNLLAISLLPFVKFVNAITFAFSRKMNKMKF